MSFQEKWQSYGNSHIDQRDRFLEFLQSSDLTVLGTLLSDPALERRYKRLILESIPEDKWTLPLIQVVWDSILLEKPHKYVSDLFTSVPLYRTTLPLFKHIVENHIGVFHWFVAHYDNMSPAGIAEMSPEAYSLHESLLMCYLRKSHWTGSGWTPTMPTGLWTQAHLDKIASNLRMQKVRRAKEKRRRDWSRLAHRALSRKNAAKRRIRNKEFSFIKK